MEEIICNCWWPQHVNNIRISDHHVSKHIWTYIIFVIRFNRFQRTSVETRGPTKYRGRGRFHLVSVVKHWIRRVRGATARPVCLEPSSYGNFQIRQTPTESGAPGSISLTPIELSLSSSLAGRRRIDSFGWLLVDGPGQAWRWGDAGDLGDGNAGCAARQSGQLAGRPRRSRHVVVCRALGGALP